MRFSIRKLQRLAELHKMAGKLLTFPSSSTIAPQPDIESPKPDIQPRPKLDPFTKGYIKGALFTNDDEEGKPLNRDYTENNLSIETIEQMKNDCENFQRTNNEALIEVYTSLPKYMTDDEEEWAGIQFWLSRNGHGAGFQDFEGKVFKQLHEAAKKFGGYNLFVGDDDKIYGL